MAASHIKQCKIVNLTDVKHIDTSTFCPRYYKHWLTACTQRISLLFSEQQPRVRGWLLASVDGQTTGLVPANYVKVLGRRRGRKHAELERMAQAQQAAQNLPVPQTALATASVPDSRLVIPTTSVPDELLESAYGQTQRFHAALEVQPSTNNNSDTVVITSEKMDLWIICMGGQVSATKSVSFIRMHHPLYNLAQHLQKERNKWKMKVLWRGGRFPL